MNSVNAILSFMSSLEKRLNANYFFMPEKKNGRLCFAQQPRRIGPNASRALLAAGHPTENGGHHRVVEGGEQWSERPCRGGQGGARQQQPVMLHLGLPLDPLQRHDSLAVLTLSNTPKAQRM
jgi:hypothetical protein